AKKMHFTHASNDRAAGTTGIPCAMGYGLYVVSSARRAVWPPSLADTIIRKLDPSVGGSGPHDFAVRAGPARRARPVRPSHPAPRFVTIGRSAPLAGAGQREDNHIFPKNGRKKFCVRGLDIAWRGF